MTYSLCSQDPNTHLCFMCHWLHSKTCQPETDVSKFHVTHFVHATAVLISNMQWLLISSFPVIYWSILIWFYINCQLTCSLIYIVCFAFYLISWVFLFAIFLSFLPHGNSSNLVPIPDFMVFFFLAWNVSFSMSLQHLLWVKHSPLQSTMCFFRLLIGPVPCSSSSSTENKKT